MQLCDVEENNNVIFDVNFDFSETGEPTLIETPEGLEENVVTYILGGGAYNKEKITKWGRAKYDDLSFYFEDTFSGVSVVESPFTPLVIDWLLIEGVPLGQNFQLRQV